MLPNNQCHYIDILELSNSILTINVLLLLLTKLKNWHTNFQDHYCMLAQPSLGFNISPYNYKYLSRCFELLSAALITNNNSQLSNSQLSFLYINLLFAETSLPN